MVLPHLLKEVFPLVIRHLGSSLSQREVVQVVIGIAGHQRVAGDLSCSGWFVGVRELDGLCGGRQEEGSCQERDSGEIGSHLQGSFLKFLQKSLLIISLEACAPFICLRSEKSQKYPAN